MAKRQLKRPDIPQNKSALFYLTMSGYYQKRADEYDELGMPEEARTAREFAAEFLTLYDMHAPVNGRKSEGGTLSSKLDRGSEAPFNSAIVFTEQDLKR